MKTAECIPSLIRLGFTDQDAYALRRIAMTLHRWHELKCGDGDEYCSWAIERDETTNKPFMVNHTHRNNYGWSVWCRLDDEPSCDDVRVKGAMVRATSRTFASKENATAYLQTIAPSREPEIRPVLTHRTAISDRETGAMKRLTKLMERYPALRYYVQGDPRGASLYILRPGDVPEGQDPDAYYSRGIAVYR